MPPRTTRASKAKGVAAADDTDSPAAAESSRAYTLEAESTTPPRLFVLPKKATADARIVTLPHPRYASKPTRYLVCPETGVYEFTQIAAPKAEPRSWLITDASASAIDKAEGAAETSQEPEEKKSFTAQTTQNADLFVATAIDPLFLILPALVAEPSFTSGSDSPPPRHARARSGSPASAPKAAAKRMFLTADDHFDALPQDGGSHLAQLLRHQPKVRDLFTKRMAVACDTVAAGDETMYRLNEDKVLLALVGKAQRTSQGGQLPASLEEKFVVRALEAPVQSRRSTAGVVASSAASASSSIATTGATNGSSTPLSTAGSTDSAESQATTTASLVSEASTVSVASTAATSVITISDDDDAATVQAAMQAPDEVIALQRLRVAFQFICSRYVPPALTATLTAKLIKGASSGIDFAPLDAYLTKLAKMRQETALARSAALDYAGGRKRGLEDEDEDDRAEKKRKQMEEEKRKKANESRGVRDLKKVNVTGMKKLSEFFKKK
ncbi:hypothetical protein SCUCBS95973_006327 [Sporothrix curviconia]|uniref:Ribonuclease H2 subunit B n=1 Tax=Sporothrix curviconia TaxID=1260050 RepID=A0ABP0C4S1_9PEZI